MMRTSLGDPPDHHHPISLSPVDSFKRRIEEFRKQGYTRADIPKLAKMIQQEGHDCMDTLRLIWGLPPAPEEKSGFIYLIRMLEYVKIGRSKNVRERISFLSCFYPVRLELVLHLACTDSWKAESWLHQKFRHQRRRGEWFELDDSDIRYIKGLKDGFYLDQPPETDVCNGSSFSKIAGEPPSVQTPLVDGPQGLTPQ